MKLNAEGGDVVLRELYNGIVLETSEGNQIGLCMRDDTIEFNVMPEGKNSSNWWRVNMQSGTVDSMTGRTDLVRQIEAERDRYREALEYASGRVASARIALSQDRPLSAKFDMKTAHSTIDTALEVGGEQAGDTDRGLTEQSGRMCGTDTSSGDSSRVVRTPPLAPDAQPNCLPATPDLVELRRLLEIIRGLTLQNSPAVFNKATQALSLLPDGE